MRIFPEHNRKKLPKVKTYRIIFSKKNSQKKNACRLQNFDFTSFLAILLTPARVAQWKSRSLLSLRSWVRFPPRVPFFTFMKFQLDNLVTEYEHLDQELADPAIYSDIKKLKSINQKKKNLEKTVELYREYKMLYANYEEAKTLVVNEKDPEMLEMMKMEITSAEEKIPLLEEALKIALLPKDPNDEKNIILEVRAGAGGDEAGLFALELAEAYKNFARAEGYQVDVMSESWNDA